MHRLAFTFFHQVLLYADFRRTWSSIWTLPSVNQRACFALNERIIDSFRPHSNESRDLLGGINGWPCGQWSKSSHVCSGLPLKFILHRVFKYIISMLWVNFGVLLPDYLNVPLTSPKIWLGTFCLILSDVLQKCEHFWPNAQ